MAGDFRVQSYCRIRKKGGFPKTKLSCLLSFLLGLLRLLNSILVVLVVRIITSSRRKTYPNLADHQNHKNYPQNHQQYLQFHLPIPTNSSKNVVADEDERNIPPQFDHNLQHFQQYFIHHQQQQEQEQQEEEGQVTRNHQQLPVTIRELYSQLATENYGPISENSPVVKKRAFGNTNAGTAQVRQKSAMLAEECEQEVQQEPPVSTRSALRRAGVGEIVEVQGGHIIRATGRKDRHSKVCTAKGPRDRRVRLSAHTAIQFYDVQDRLGYDRPSKAVDWLIKKAKSAIDELEQLPAWSPTNVSLPTATRRRGKAPEKMNELVSSDVGGGTGAGTGGDHMYVDEQQHQQQHNNSDEQQHMYSNASNSLLPPSMHSDSIADTIKSFFPMGGAAAGGAATSSASDYSHHGGGGSMRHSQDLRLSLQSFQVQDPILMHSHQQHQHHQQHSVYPGAAAVGYENPNAGWADSQHQSSPELGRLHRMMAGWHNHSHQQNSSIDQQQQHHSGSGNVIGLGCAGSASGGYMFNQPPLLQPLFGGQHSHFFTQRGPLQSSNTPSIRAWISDHSIASSNSDYHQAIPVHPQALSGLGYPSGGFSGFHIPARIQGEEEHDGDPNKPSSASSGSRH